MIVFPKLASGCPLPINQLPANLQCIKAQKFSSCRNFSTYIKLLSSLISTEGARRLPTTYDNQSHPSHLVRQTQAIAHYAECCRFFLLPVHGWGDQNRFLRHVDYVVQSAITSAFVIYQRVWGGSKTE